MKKLTFLVLLLNLSSLASVAQDYSGNLPDRWKSGSIYSYFGIGIPSSFFSSQASGMGLEGVALYNSLWSNGANPALWGFPVYTNGVGNIYVDHFAVDDENDAAKFNNSGIGSMQVMFPIERNRLGLHVGLQPYTRVAYRVSTTASKEQGALLPNESVDYATVQYGYGGLNQLEMGLGLSISKNISIGIAPNLSFGVINRFNQVAFDTLIFENVEFRNREIYQGFSARTGIYLNFTGLLNTTDNLGIGFTYDLPRNLTSRERLYTTYVTDEVELSGSENQMIEIPSKWVAGIAYRPSRYVLVSTEMAKQEWSSFKDTGAIEEVTYKDQSTYRFGMEISPKATINSSYLKNLIYRGGLSYDTGYLKFGTSKISTTQVHFGVGIPSRFTSSSVDVELSYGIRTPNDENYVREKIFHARLSFNLSEVMFLKRKLQ
jgi:hypothetical protein